MQPRRPIVVVFIYTVCASVCSCSVPELVFQPPRDQNRASTGEDPQARISMVSVTSMNNEMFVAYVQEDCRDTAIEVYDTANFTLEKHIVVPGLGQVRCLTSCAAIECLYVSDSRGRRVFRVGVSGTGYSMSWRVSDRPAGLTATAGDNVLVTFPDESCVREYTPHGMLVRHLSLTCRPEHVVQLVGDRFAISSDQGVCIVNKTGQTVCEYSSGRGSMKLKRPMGLVAVENGCILVADQALDRVVVLNPELTGARVLALPIIVDALRSPWTLHLDRPRSRLYVGEFNARNVEAESRSSEKYRFAGHVHIIDIDNDFV